MSSISRKTPSPKLRRRASDGTAQQYPDNLDVAKLYIGHLEARVKKLEADLETIDTEAKGLFREMCKQPSRAAAGPQKRTNNFRGWHGA